MIGTIRKHSKWMWGVVITATIASFIFWGTYSGGRNSGGGGHADYGSIYGKPISRNEFVNAYREMEMRYFFNYNEWPGSDATRRGFNPEQETYFRILLVRKAAQLDIQVSLDAIAKYVNQMLGGNPAALNELLTKVLVPRGLTAADFERYVRNELGIQQLLSLAGASGRFVTPLDARAIYEREHQEYVASAVFLHPSNYLSSVTSTPEALGQFFTNQLSRYRIPERVRISYVKFEATNFLAEIVAEINKITNLTERLEEVYQKRGGTNFYTDKSPADAQAEILKEEQNQGALLKARAKANAFAVAVMETEPVRVENFSAAAQTNGFPVETTPPFTPNEAPVGLNVGEEFMHAAFGLTETEPVAGPVMGKDAVYVIAIHSRLPSEAPKYEDVRDRVTKDYEFYESAMATRTAGQNIANTVSNAMAGGKSFVAACVDARAQPVALPPFSLSATNIPEVEQHMNLTQFKQSMFMTPVGKVSSFVQNNDGGGFILHVQQKLPVDETRLAVALPDYMRTIRQARQNEAVNMWVSAEGQRDPGFRGIMAELSKRNQPQPPGGAPLN